MCAETIKTAPTSFGSVFLQLAPRLQVKIHIYIYIRASFFRAAVLTRVLWTTERCEVFVDIIVLKGYNNFRGVFLRLNAGN